MSTSEQIELLDDLQSLLEKQIELIQQCNPAGKRIEVLCEQAGSLVEKITQTGILESAEFKNRQEQLQKLYKDLCLALTDAKADTAKKLSRLRKGKKAIGTYHSNI